MTRKESGAVGDSMQRQSNTNSERIAQIRRRKRRREFRILVVGVLLAACAGAYFLGLFSAPLSLLGDWKDTVSIALAPGDGYPRSYSVAGFVEAKELAGGVAVLGEGEVVLYSASGSELRRISHGYARPCITVGDTRLCLYNRAGKELNVESRSRHLFSQTMDEAITVADMSPNGTLAVATKTAVTVYSPTFERIWRWQDTSATTLLVAFGPDNRSLAAACLQAENGTLGTVIHCFSTSRDTETASVSAPSALPVQMRYLSRTRLLVLYDTYAAVYDTGTGAETAHYDYGARLLQSAGVGKNKTVALLFGNGDYSSVASLVVLNEELAEQQTQQLAVRASSVAVGHTMVYVLTGSSVLVCGSDGTQREVTLGTRPLTVLDADEVLLLTKDEITDVLTQNASSLSEYAAQNAASKAAQSAASASSAGGASSASLSEKTQQAASLQDSAQATT